MRIRRFSPLLAAVVFTLATAAPLAAQSNPRYVRFTPNSVKGTLYVPDAGPAPHVAVLVMHRTGNFMTHLACRELSARGFAVLCMNSRFDNNESLVEWDEIALDVASGVKFLRQQPGITRVLLLGHSGGGPTMSFYQAVAEKGPSYCKGPNKLLECSDALAGLPPADGLIFPDAHPGNPVQRLRDMSPALVSEERPDRVDPALDPFNPANGYNPKGPSSYSPEFQQRYFKAQSQRMNRLIDQALAMVRDMKAGTHRFPDNDIFVVPRIDYSRLAALDPSIQHATKKPHKLLKNDGTIVTQIVESVRVPELESQGLNPTFNEGAMGALTVRAFLSANAVRSTNSLDGIDHCSSNNSTVCALPNISVPVLFASMSAHYYLQDAEIHYEVAGSKDKDLVYIEGAVHGFTPCVKCETFPGQYSNTVKNLFDYIRDWANKRF